MDHALPHKFVYRNGGAPIWDAIQRDAEYLLGSRELRTLDDTVRSFATQTGNTSFNVIHLGPGNGAEVPIVVGGVTRERIRSYVLLDISSEMLALAESRIRCELGCLNLLCVEHDVSDRGLSTISGRVRALCGSPNLFVLAGNGGMLSELACLRSVREAMVAEDRLLITLEFFEPDRKEAILKQFGIRSIVDLFGRSLAQLGIREPRPEEFEFRYAFETALVEVFFVPGPSRNALHVPERLRVFASFRPTPERLRTTLESFGFAVHRFETFGEQHCCGVVCGISEGPTDS